MQALLICSLWLGVLSLQYIVMSRALSVDNAVLHVLCVFVRAGLCLCFLCFPKVRSVCLLVPLPPAEKGSVPKLSEKTRSPRLRNQEQAAFLHTATDRFNNYRLIYFTVFELQD